MNIFGKLFKEYLKTYFIVVYIVIVIQNNPYPDKLFFLYRPALIYGMLNFE